MIDLKQVLLKKFKDQTLASFYLLRASATIPHKKAFLREWVQEFLILCGENDLFSPANSSSASFLPGLNLNYGHPDILYIKRLETDEKGHKVMERDYGLKEFQEFFKFLTYRPFQFSHRFVVVEDVHLIGETLANKLLKSLESPGDHLTIFFLHSVDKKLLPTLQSRSIQLRLRNPSAIKEEGPYQGSKTVIEKIAWFDQHVLPEEELAATLPPPGKFLLPANLKELLLNYLKDQNQLHDLLESLKKHKESHEVFLALLIAWERQHLTPYQHKKKFLDELQWFAEAQTYYNASGERLFSLLQTLSS